MSVGLKNRRYSAARLGTVRLWQVRRSMRVARVAMRTPLRSSGRHEAPSPPRQRPGAAIEGEAGVGSGLKPGFPLPPLMFTLEAIEALGTHDCPATANLLISQGKTSAARGGGDTGGTDGDDLSGLL